MTHLAETQSVINVIDKVIAHIASVRVVAGNATHGFTGSFFGRIRFALVGMAFAGGRPDNMVLGAYMAMARQAELIDWHDQLGLML